MASQAFLEKAYLAYFGRPVDPVGAFAFKDSTEAQVYTAFYESAESRALYGDGFGPTQINAIYQMLFGRDAEPAGVTYWTLQVNTGVLTPASAALGILNGAKNQDAVNVANKLAASHTFTTNLDTLIEVSAYVGDGAAAYARDFLKTVSTLPATSNQITTTINHLVEQAGANISGSANVFTLKESVIQKSVPVAGIPAQYVTYWGYNPHTHEDGITVVDNTNSGLNSPNLTNEGPRDGGVPLSEALSFFGSLVGLDFVQLGLINIASGTDNGFNGLVVPTGSTASATSTSTQTFPAATGITVTGTTGGTQNITVTYADGTANTAEVQISEMYFKLLHDMLFDAQGNTRLYQRVVDGTGIPAGTKTVSALQPIILTPYDTNGGTIETNQPTTANNDLIVAGRLELLHQAYIDGGAGYNILEVDAKGTYAQPASLKNIQEIRVNDLPNWYTNGYTDASGNNVSVGANGGNLNNTAFNSNGFLTPTGTGSDDSWLDLSRAVDIKKLVVTDESNSATSGSTDYSGALTIVGVRNGATLRLEGGFNSGSTTIQYGQGQTGTLNVELALGDVNAAINILQNSAVLNIDSTGVVNHMHAFFAGGSISRMIVKGTGEFAVDSNIATSFNKNTAVIIDASANTGGLNINFGATGGSGSTDRYESVTVKGTTVNDTIFVTGVKALTGDQVASNNGATTPVNGKVTIDAGNGDNSVVTNDSAIVKVTTGTGDDTVISKNGEVVTIVAGDGSNVINADASKIVSITSGTGDDNISVQGTTVDTVTVSTGDGVNLVNTSGAGKVTITTGAGNDTIVSKDGLAVSITAGDGNNSINADQTLVSTAATGSSANLNLGVVTITTGAGNDSISAINNKTVTVTAGDGNNSITASGSSITVTTGIGNDTVTLSGLDKIFDNGDLTEGLDQAGGFNTGNQDNYGITENFADTLAYGSVVTLNLGAGVNTVTLGRDYKIWDTSGTPAEKTVQYGLTALEGSSITGTGVKLYVENNSDLTQADLSGATISSVMLKQELRITAEQFKAIGSAAFTTVRDEEGATEDLYIVVSSDATLSTLVDLTKLSTNVRLHFELHSGATLTLSAAELHKYVAVQGIDSTDGLNGKVVITNAGMSFDAFNTGAVNQVIAGGSLSDSFTLSEDVSIIRTVEGYERPAPLPSTDVQTIDSTGTAPLVVSTAIITEAQTLKIIGNQPVTFTKIVDLGSDTVTGGVPTDTLTGSPAETDAFVVDFSTLTGKVTGLTLDHFQDVKEIKGNGVAGTRIDVILNANVGTSGINAGLKTSGVDTYMVTRIDVGQDGFPDNAGSLTFNLCDLTQDVKFIGLKGNAGSTLVLANVPWGKVAPHIVLEGDGYANASDALKVDGSPDTSDVGSITANYFVAGAPAVVDINNNGVELGVTAAGLERKFAVGTITLTNAASVTVNVAQGDATIKALDITTGGAATASVKFVATEDVTVTDQLPAVLKTIDASGVVGAFKATIGDSGHPINVTGGAGLLDLTLNAVVLLDTAEEGSSIVGGAGKANLTVLDTSNLSKATLTNVDKVVVADGKQITLTMAQVAAIDIADITTTGTSVNTKLNLVGLDNTPFSVTGLTKGMYIGTVTLASNAVITLDPTTNLTGVDTLVVPDGTTLNMTAAQFQQLTLHTITGSGLAGKMGTVNITGLKQADITKLDVNGNTVFTDAGDHANLQLSGITGVKMGTVTLAESVKLSTADNFGTFKNIVMGNDLTLSVSDLSQADGLKIAGGTNTALQILDTNPLVNAVTSATVTGKIDASGFNVTTVKMLNVLVANQNVDFILDHLPANVTKEIYNDLTWVTKINQIVTLTAGTTVAGSLVFDPITNDTELQNFTLNLSGGNEISGNLNLATTAKVVATANQMLTHLDTLTINSNGVAANTNLLSGKTANIITGDVTALALTGAQADNASVAVGAATNNNLLKVVITAAQDLKINGDMVFSSVVGDDNYTGNDDSAAIAALTVSGAANVALGTVNTQDDEVDGLTVTNSGTGSLSLTLDAAKLDQTPVTNNDALKFLGSKIALTIKDGSSIDLSDDLLTGVSSIVINAATASNGTLTLTQAQYNTLTITNLSTDSGAGTLAGGVATLNLNAFDGATAFDATAFTTAKGITLGTISMAAGSQAIAATTNLTGVTQIIVPEGGTLSLTAKQFQQLGGTGSIIGFDTDGLNGIGSYNVVITDLKQTDVTFDANADGDTIDAADTLNLSGIVGAKITVKLGEPSVTLGTYDATNNVLSSAVLNGAKFELSDAQTLTLATSVQANGLTVTKALPTDATTLVLRFASLTGGTTQIDASKYSVSTLKALAVFVGGTNVEALLLNVASSIEERYYRDPLDLGFVNATNRVAVVEKTVSVPSYLMYNDLQTTQEVRTLKMTLDGGSRIEGKIDLSTVNKSTSLTAQYFDQLNLVSNGTATDKNLANKNALDAATNKINGDITAQDNALAQKFTLTFTGTATAVGSVVVGGSTYAVTIGQTAAQLATAIQAAAPAGWTAVAVGGVVTFTSTVPAVTANAVVSGSAAGLTYASATTVQHTLENNLLNVDVSNAVAGVGQALVVTGDIVFSSVTNADPTLTLHDAKLTDSSAANVTIQQLNVADADVTTLTISNTGAGTLTITGASPAIFDGQDTGAYTNSTPVAGSVDTHSDANLATLTIAGSGAVVLGDADLTTTPWGISASNLAVVNVTSTGSVSLGEVKDVSSTGFAFTAGSGTTKMTFTTDTLDAVAGTTAVPKTATWSFDFSTAGANSEFHLADATVGAFGNATDLADVNTSNALNIKLGNNTTLYVDVDTDLTQLDTLSINTTGTQAIVLAKGVDLYLTAAQASGLKITNAAGIITDPLATGYVAADVPKVHISKLSTAAYDFSGIATAVSGEATLAADDVALAATTNLGDMTVQLEARSDDVGNLTGQTIRFATTAQADNKVTVVDAVDEDGAGTLDGNPVPNNSDLTPGQTSSSNVVWLFSAVTGAVETKGYSASIGRVWFNAALINSNGGLVENLFTTLPAQILRVDFTDLTALNALLNSAAVPRVMELANFTTVGNLTFSDVGLSPVEHLSSLTLNMGGQVTVGNVVIDDVVGAPGYNPASIAFDTLTVNSRLALTGRTAASDTLGGGTNTNPNPNYLASQAYVNNNDGILQNTETALPNNINTVGNLGVGAANGLDLLKVKLNTYNLSVYGDGTGPNADRLAGDGAKLQVGTVTFGTAVANSAASLTVLGANDINVTSVVATDLDITSLVLTATDFTGVLTVPGNTPGVSLGDNVNTFTITNNDVASSKEKFTLALDTLNAGVAIVGLDTITFDGTVVTLAGGETRAQVNTALAAATYQHWTAAVVGATVEFTAKATANVTDVVIADFVLNDVGVLSTNFGLGVNTVTKTVDGGLLAGTITLGSATHAGVSGTQVSVLNASGFDGTLNLGTLNQIDSNNDDATPLTAANDKLLPAFTLTTGAGTTTATLGLVEGVKPALEAGSEWKFDYSAAAAGSSLTITSDVTFNTAPGVTTTLNVRLSAGSQLIVANTLDLSILGAGLLVSGSGQILVGAGTTLTLTAAQVKSLGVLGTVDVVGQGTVKVIGDATNYTAAMLGAHLKAANVDISGVTLVLLDPVPANNDTDGAVSLTLSGGIMDNGFSATGQNVLGTGLPDIIITSAQADTILGTAGNDTLTGGAGANSIDGGAGDDRIVVATAAELAANASVIGGANTDTIWVTGAAATLIDTDFAKVNTVENLVLNGGGVNVVTLGANSSAAFASGITITAPGATTLTVNGALSTVMITATGTAGADTLIGGSAADSLDGAGGGADSIIGNAGNDTIVGANGAVLLDGGADSDVLQIGANFNDASDAQIIRIETVNLTAAGLTVLVDAQTEALAINAFANSALITGVATNGTLTTAESSTYTLTNVMNKGESLTIDGATVTATTDGHSAAEVAGIFRTGLTTGLTGIAITYAVGVTFTQPAGWAATPLVSGAGATLTLTNTVNGDVVADLTASSTIGDSITGGLGADTITGSNGVDIIDGNTGADSIMAGASNDIILGEQADVLIDGGTGSDVLQVAANFDDVSNAQIVNTEAVNLAGALGQIVILDAQTEGLTINASANGSTIVGGSGNDTVVGGGAADSLNGGVGADNINGGLGNDTIVGAQDDAVLNGGGGADQLQIGAAFNDVSDAQIVAIQTANLTVAGLTVSLDAQTEGMTINAFANYAPVTGAATPGTAGSAELTTFTMGAITAGQSVTINGLTVTASATYVTGADDGRNVADAFRGTVVAGLTLSGASGTPAGWTGAAIVGGTAATNSLIFTNTVVGDVTNFVTSLSGPGATITGGLGNDTITGSNGIDSLVGGAGNDSIVAGAGNDVIVGAQGDVLLDGGADADVLQLGANFTDTGGNGQIVNTESAILTATGLSVSLATQSENLLITGFAAGASTIVGGTGGDTITGGSGNDSLTGANGVDSVDGGGGNDIIVVSNAGDNAAAETLVGGANTDTLLVVDTLSLTTATVSGFEAITLVANGAALSILASELADNTIATVTGNTLGATVETVTFVGTALVDNITLAGITAVTDASLVVTAGNGDDNVTGSNFADSLNGEAGADTITGGLGNDSMTGGGAADTFVFSSADAVAEIDSISDWGFGGANDNIAGKLGAGDQLNVLFDVTYIAPGVIGAPVPTNASGGLNGTVTFLDSYTVGDTITVTIGAGPGVVAVSRTVLAGKTSGLDVALSFENVFDSITMNANDADLVDGGGAASVLPAGVSGGILYINNDSGGDGAFNLTTAIIQASGYVFDASGTSGSGIAATNGVVSVTGSSGNDTIIGGNAADTISGLGGNDVLTGAGGNDTFNVTLGTDSITDLATGDIVVVTGTGVIANNVAAFVATTFTNSGTATLNAASGGSTINVATATGNAFTLNGAGGVDLLTGSGGNDTITGAGGNDVISGNAGNDSITGGAGSDDLNGGLGLDLFIYAVGDANVVGFADVGAVTTAIAPGVGDTFTATEVIRGLITGDTVQLGNAALALDGATVGTLEANEYMLIGGTFSGNVFTYGAGGDTLVIYDADAAGGIQQAAIVLTGVATGEWGAITNTAGLLAVFGA
jgi:Ca2+-binding RTX toxin-like protein